MMPRPQVRLSRRLIERIKLHPSKRQYQIAVEAGFSPSLLSRMLAGYAPLAENDARVLKLGQVVGMNKTQLFAKVSPTPAEAK